MRIKVLGCSGGVGPDLRTTSLLVDDEILIDAGTGVGELSLAQMRRIGNIFITHSHLDHVCGLAFMADNLFDLIDRPVQIHAIAETLAAIREHIFNWKIWPDFSALPSVENPLIKFHEVKVGESLERNGIRFTPFTVLHTVPAVGYAVEKDGHVFVFSGDTYANDPLWEFMNQLPRVDKFMVDIAFPDEEEELGRASKHFTPSLLGRELKKLKHRPKLFLTHHKPGLEQIIDQQCRKALAGWDYQHLRRGDVIEP